MAARTAADYLHALLALLPRGRIWPRARATAISTVLEGLSPSPARVDARAEALLVDAFPITAYELLPVWEASLGLPDPCAGPAPSLQARRDQVGARLTARGGQSAAYYTQVAARLGYSITVREYAPSRFGVMRFGDRFQDAPWAHVWAVQAQQTTVTSFRFGASAFGERFASWGNDVLECELRARAPAHTILLFQYS